MASEKLYTDQVSDIDTLDRKRFATQISKNILNYFETQNQSLVIGIHGAWGNGKSTLLNFIKKEIEASEIFRNGITAISSDTSKSSSRKKVESRKLFILDFNPWMFSGKEQLHRFFLNDFANKIGSRSHKIRTKVRKFSNYLGVAESFLPSGGAVSKSIADSSELSIPELKNEINELLVKEDIHVLVMMDDIDRLIPSEIIEVFQLVKLNANFSNTLFLVSFDKGTVNKAIKREFHFDGEKYLEKIIQVDYGLPQVHSDDIEALFFNMLQKVLTSSKINWPTSNINSAWLYRGLKYYFNNIRDLNRYFNSLEFRLPSIYREIDIHDFLLIEAIRLFDFKSYEVIRNNFKEATRFGKESYHHSNLTRIKNQPASDLFNYIFYNNDQPQKPLLNDFRIRNTEFFDRYFSFSISKKDMRQEDFSDFIQNDAARQKILEDIIRNGKIDFLLRRLAAPPENTNSIELTKAIPPLLAVWDNFQKSFSEHWRNCWAAIKSIVLNSGDETHQFNLLIDQLCSSTSEFSPARFVFLWFIVQKIEGKEALNNDTDLEPFADLLADRKEHILRQWIMNLENTHMQFGFSNNYDKLYSRIYFPNFARYLPEKYEQYFPQLIRDSQRIFKIIDILVIRDSTTSEPFRIDPHYMPVLLPDKMREQFINRLKGIKPNSLSKHDAKAIEGLLHHFEKEEDPFIGRRKI